MTVVHARAPEFTVVICNYNYDCYVGDAIGSCLAQTYPPEQFEVIVVDDGSTDNSRAAIMPYLNRGNVRAIFQPNRGQAAAFAAGVAEARGRLVCLLDSDDLFLADKLASLAARIQLLEPLPENFFLCHDLVVRDHALGVIAEHSWFRVRGLPLTAAAVTLSTVDPEYPFAVPCGQVYSRRLIQRLAAELPLGEWRLAADFAFAQAAFLACGELHLLHKVLAVYRVHGRNDSASIADGAYRFRQPSAPNRGPKKLQLMESVADVLPGDLRRRAERLAYIKRLERKIRACSASLRLRPPLGSFVILDRGAPESLERTVRACLSSVHWNVELVVVTKQPERLAGLPLSLLDSRVRGVAVAPDANGDDAFLAGYRTARGDYIAVVPAGDCPAQLFFEHHVFVHRGMKPCSVTSCRALPAGTTQIAACSSRGSLTAPGAHAANARSGPSPLTEWPFSRLSGNVLAKTRSLDLLFDPGRESKALRRGGSAVWLMMQYARILGSVHCFDEPLVNCGTEDTLSEHALLAPISADSATRDCAEAACVLLSVICDHLAEFENIFPVSWQEHTASWLARGQTGDTVRRLATIARRSGCHRIARAMA